jgi:pimeloyl-ACP methyl ester carboxylesterase
MKDLSKLTAVKPDQGKAQWVECQITGIAKDEAKRTHLVGIPPLMPCTTIFVHGVNSDGEWYEDAAGQFAAGLNQRLGRNDLKELVPEEGNAKRFQRQDKAQKRTNSPILPFYWGYKVPSKSRIKLVDSARTGDRPDAWADRFGNPLRPDGSWGGGPFQNGTNSLLQFWQPGFDKTIGPLDVNLVNPVVGRTLNNCPDRTYYVHAARRLAHLVATVRADFPDEPINLVAHSQGTMIALCALFYLKEQGVRGPDTVILNSSPYRFDNQVTDFLTAASGARDVQTEEARVATFRAAAAIVQEARTGYVPQPAPDAACTHKPVARRTKLRRHLRAWTTRSLTLVSATLLTACSLGGLGGPYPGVPALSDAGRAQPYTGEVAAPQVAYRIDENRYFEIVPYGRGACTNAMVQFVDKAKGIRSDAVLFDWGPMVEAKLIIDASNDQYLVAPVTRGNTDCSSGGGLCGGSKLPYSTDGGRTWKRVEVPFTYGPVDSRGVHVYVSTANARIDRRETEILALSTANPTLKDWQTDEPLGIPVPKLAPIDTKFHCTVNGKE